MTTKNMNDNKDYKVLGFDITTYDMPTLEKTNDRRKYELYLEDDENVRCWDCPQDFFIDLNDEQVDTENMYYFLVGV